MSAEEIISKQKFQELFDIKKVANIKKVAETTFEVTFAALNDEEVKTGNVGIKNKDINNTTHNQTIVNDEERPVKVVDNTSEQSTYYTDLPKDYTIENFVIMLWQSHNIIKKIQSNQNTNSEIISSLVKQLEKIAKNNDIFQNSCTTLLNSQNDTLDNLSNTVNRLLNIHISRQEITEIVNKAISSYNETNKNNDEETKLYHAQILQMYKDLNEKINKLENIPQKVETTEESVQTLELTNTVGNQNDILNNFLAELNNIKTNEKCTKIENLETLFSDDYVKNLIDSNINISELLSKEVLKDNVLKKFENNKHMQTLIGANYSLIILTLVDKYTRLLPSNQQQNNEEETSQILQQLSIPTDVQPNTNTSKEPLNTQTEEVEVKEQQSEPKENSNQQSDAEGMKLMQSSLPKQSDKKGNLQQSQGVPAKTELAVNTLEQPQQTQNASKEPLNTQVEEAEESEEKSEREDLVQSINIKAMINNLSDALGKFDVVAENIEVLHGVRAIESNILVNKLGNAIKTINTLSNNLTTLSSLVGATTDVLAARTQAMNDFSESIADDINNKQEITGIGVKIVEAKSFKEIGEEAIKNIKKLSNKSNTLTLATSLNEIKEDFDRINARYGNKFSHLKALM